MTYFSLNLLYIEVMNRIAVFTSGGDSPGMNAAIRGIVRSAIYNNIEVLGVRRGLQGLIEGDFRPMDAKSVANIIGRGGTVLKTARSEYFRTEEGRKKANDQIKSAGIDGLIAVGGNGTFTGLDIFHKEHKIPSVGLPGTIDNDLAGTDFTIGFDTAVNTAMRAIDNIRDTAMAHERVFVVEVMGRDAGYLALYSGLATGAEDVLIPESPTEFENMMRSIDLDRERRKNVRIIIVAEGDEFGGGASVVEKIKKARPELEVKLAILGHIQRGGSPTCNDRVLSSRLGYYAVQSLLAGETSIMLGVQSGKITKTPYEDAILQSKAINLDLLEIIKTLSI